MSGVVKTVTFFSEGQVIAADLFTPGDLAADRKYPAVAICQGFTGIRRTPLIEAIGAALNDAGYVAISFDYRGWGNSGGERGRLAPLEQVDDIRNTLTYLETLGCVDADRLGLICALKDSTADPDSLRELFSAAKQPKRWIEVEGAGHYDLYQPLFDRFRTEIVKFFGEFIGFE